MRFVALIVAAAALVASGPAFAEWQEYPYKDLGFVVLYPAPPTQSVGEYRSTLVTRRPTINYTLKQGNEVYTATVVDIHDLKDQGSNVLGEVDSWLSYQGDVADDANARVEPSTDAVYGRQLTIVTRPDVVGGQKGQADYSRNWYIKATGLQFPRGTRLIVAIYYLRGRLYMISGANLPQKDGTLGPDALLFANSISFYDADGKRNPDDDPAIQDKAKEEASK